MTHLQAPDFEKESYIKTIKIFSWNRLHAPAPNMKQYFLKYKDTSADSFVYKSFNFQTFVIKHFDVGGCF